MSHLACCVFVCLRLISYKTIGVAEHLLFYMCMYFSRIDQAAKSSYKVEEGDVLLMGTDGLFDNMHEDMILDCIAKYKVSTRGL